MVNSYFDRCDLIVSIARMQAVKLNATSSLSNYLLFLFIAVSSCAASEKRLRRRQRWMGIPSWTDRLRSALLRLVFGSFYEGSSGDLPV